MKSPSIARSAGATPADQPPRVGPIAALARFLALALLVAVFHLAQVWLWDPRVQVPGPVRARARPPAQDRAWPDDEVVVVVGGDTALTDAALPDIARYGHEYPLSATVDLLRAADLTVVNLEAPVTRRDRAFPLYKRYIYKIDPAGLSALTWAGVDAVSLANNHVMDYGRPGLLDTLGHLAAAGITPVGAGRSEAQARRGAVFSIRGARIALLSYMEDSFMHSLYVRSFAQTGESGCARLATADVQADVRRMRRSADVVVVLVHWGKNYRGVTWSQRMYGAMMIDAGADAVIGHGPHVHQPAAMHRGKPILYSVGNYAFGTPGAARWFRYGLLARLRIKRRRLRRVELIPLLVQNRVVRFRPYRLDGPEARDMLQNLAAESSRMGATVRVADNTGIIDL